MNGVAPRLLLLLTQHIDETLFVLFVSQENVFLYSECVHKITVYSYSVG